MTDHMKENLGVARGIVKLVPYNSLWPKEFQKEAQKLQKVLGDLVVHLHHVGSTSIPNLAAKPIIDILLVVNNLNCQYELQSKLKTLDYQFRLNASQEDRWFFAKGPEDHRTHYLHVTQAGTFAAKEQLLFRNYLRTHPAAREEYSLLKYELMAQYTENRTEYTAQKSNFISNILKKARKLTRNNKANLKIIFSAPQSFKELKEAFEFITNQLEITANHPRQLDFYQKIYETNPSLLVIAKQHKQIIGCAFGSKNQFKPELNTEVTIGEVCVHPDFQGQHIGKRLLKELERNAKKYGYTKLILGARKGVENFYFKCGFSANLHIQIKNQDCLDQLKHINTTYEVKDEGMNKGWTRLLINTCTLDPHLKNRYKQAFPNAFLQYVFIKYI